MDYLKSFIVPGPPIGIPDPANPLPLKGFPPGRVRVRLRPGDLGTAYVRDEGGVRQFLLVEQDGYWVGYCEQARNLTLTSAPDHQ